MRVFVRVQHHPSRADLIPALLERLHPLPVEVVKHASRPPSPWGGYKCCLSDLPACTHVAILQDDTQPALNFPAALRVIAEENPDVPVILFHSRQPAACARQVQVAHRRGQRYTDFIGGNFMPVVAVLWPVEKAAELLAFGEEYERNVPRRSHRSDDQMAGTWIRRTGQRVLIAVPSIVEHLGVPTTKGTSNVESWRALYFSEDASPFLFP